MGLLRRAAFLAGLQLTSGAVLVGQFVPGTREIYSLNPAGAVPGGLVRVVRNGTPMLKAASATEFVVALPEKLPENFTLEFDIVPKQCCQPEDLGFEATSRSNRNAGRSNNSAQISWHRDVVEVRGDGQPFTVKMPSDMVDALPGTLTTVAVMFEGETIKLYTNGRRLFTLTERRFVRGRELWVFLGGQDDDKQAVYLARLRVAESSTTIAESSGSPSPPAPPPPAPAEPLSVVLVPAAPQTSAGSITPMAPAMYGVTVTAGSGGPLVKWNPVSGATVYDVIRMKTDDWTCCMNMGSRLSPTVTSWQDVALPTPGTYTFVVYAHTSAGVLLGQTWFDHSPGTPITAPATGGAISVPLGTRITAGTVAGAGSTIVRALTGITVTAGTNGPQVQWTPVAGATRYVVVRSHLDDFTCCLAMDTDLSPAQTSWQDGVLPRSGWYLYQVTAYTPEGQLQGHKTFEYTFVSQTIAAPIAGVTAASDPLAPRTTAGNVAGSTTVDLIAPPKPKELILEGFTVVVSARSAPPRRFEVEGFTVSQPTTVTAAPARAVVLGGFATTGTLMTVTPRTTVTGGLPGSTVSTLAPPRTLSLGGFGSSAVAPSQAPPMTLSLSGFASLSASIAVPPRLIKLTGFITASP